MKPWRGFVHGVIFFVENKPLRCWDTSSPLLSALSSRSPGRPAHATATGKNQPLQQRNAKSDRERERRLSSVIAALCKCEPAHLLPVKDDDTPSEAETECWGSPAASNPDVSTVALACVSRCVCVCVHEWSVRAVVVGWWGVSPDFELYVLIVTGEESKDSTNTYIYFQVLESINQLLWLAMHS